jgi:hypothetical protein
LSKKTPNFWAKIFSKSLLPAIDFINVERFLFLFVNCGLYAQHINMFFSISTFLLPKICWMSTFWRFVFWMSTFWRLVAWKF